MMARSRGVETKIIGGVERVVRIAYQRYSMDLHMFALEKQLNLDNRNILMQGMRNGIQHLHEQGLVHCDLRPPNVFVTFKEEEGDVVLEEVVVGDFDASLKIGEPVNLKRACGKWWPPHVQWGDPALPSIDEYSLEQMETWFGDCLKENGLEEYVWDNAAASPPTWPKLPSSSDEEDEIPDEIPDDIW
jgi:serine/threonine protein kinase